MRVLRTPASTDTGRQSSVGLRKVLVRDTVGSNFVLRDFSRASASRAHDAAPAPGSRGSGPDVELARLQSEVPRPCNEREDAKPDESQQARRRRRRRRRRARKGQTGRGQDWATSLRARPPPTADDRDEATKQANMQEMLRRYRATFGSPGQRIEPRLPPRRLQEQRQRQEAQWAAQAQIVQQAATTNVNRSPHEEHVLSLPWMQTLRYPGPDDWEASVSPGSASRMGASSVSPVRLSPLHGDEHRPQEHEQSAGNAHTEHAQKREDVVPCCWNCGFLGTFAEVLLHEKTCRRAVHGAFSDSPAFVAGAAVITMPRLETPAVVARLV